MCPFRKYPVLQSLLSPFRLSQQKTLALFIASIAEVAQAASIELASHLALQLGIRVDSALNRFYRLLKGKSIMKVIYGQAKELLKKSNKREYKT